MSLISDVVPIDFDFVVNNNTLLNATWNRFETPIVQHTTIDSDGYGEVPPSPPLSLLSAYVWPLRMKTASRLFFFSPSPFAELNAVELRPPRMDDSGRTKYPVLFHVYARFFVVVFSRRSGGELESSPLWLTCHICVCASRYGGPGSQTVSASFNVDWHAYLACSLQYVIVIVDGRGTGYKGRALRNPVKGNLGFWEVRDQINAARWVFFLTAPGQGVD